MFDEPRDSASSPHVDKYVSLRNAILLVYNVIVYAVLVCAD